MKKFWIPLFLFASCLYSQTHGPDRSETAAMDEFAIDPDLFILQTSSDRNPRSSSPSFESQRTKSPALAVGLSAVFPGLGHVYLGEKITAAGLMGTTLASLGGVSYSATHEKPLIPSLLALQTVWSYGMYASYRDARKFNGNSGYSYKMPSDSFA